MTPARCPTCDREGCPRFTGVHEHDGSARYECPGCIAAADCAAHRVDWRARAIAAEADAAKLARIIDAILARLGARETGTGGQTVEAGNARILSDGMRRLDRAIADAARWRKVAPLIERLADDVRRRELIARAEFDRRVSDTVTDLLAATQEPTP